MLKLRRSDPDRYRSHRGSILAFGVDGISGQLPSLHQLNQFLWMQTTWYTGECSSSHVDLIVVEVGCGLARPKHQTREQRVADIAPMFAGALELSNVFLPKAFGG